MDTGLIMQLDDKQFVEDDGKAGIFVISMFFFGLVSVGILSETKEVYYAGISVWNIVMPVIVIIFMLLIKKLTPRCPYCGMGRFSVFEIKGFPIIVKSWRGKSCLRCDARVKT